MLIFIRLVKVGGLEEEIQELKASGFFLFFFIFCEECVEMRMSTLSVPYPNFQRQPPPPSFYKVIRIYQLLQIAILHNIKQNNHGAAQQTIIVLWLSPRYHRGSQRCQWRLSPAVKMFLVLSYDGGLIQSHAEASSDMARQEHTHHLQQVMRMHLVVSNIPSDS